MTNDTTTKHTPGPDAFMGATNAGRNRMLRAERLNDERVFGELAFLRTSTTDLDLTDPQDRASFRMRVLDRLSCTTVAAMRCWVPGVAMPSRERACRVVADTYIRAAIAKATGSVK